MAELIVPPGYANASFKLKLASGPKVFSFALAFSVTDAEDPDTLAQQVSGCWTNASHGWKIANMFPQWHYLGCTVHVGNDGPTLVGNFETDITGTASSNNCPPINASLVVKKRTGFAGQKYRGRCYIPPVAVAEGNVDDLGNQTSTQRSDSPDAVNRLTAAFPLEVPTFGAHKLLHSDATLPTTITSFLVESLLGTQRRRMR